MKTAKRSADVDQRHHAHERQESVQAAVAVILRPADRLPELLLIERARRPGDPWSGHLGFPGGPVEGSDVDARHAAERETLEEVGLDFAAAHHILRLDDLTIPSPPVRVASFVYSLARTPIIRLDPEEVAAAYWIPITALQDQVAEPTNPFSSVTGCAVTLPSGCSARVAPCFGGLPTA